LESSSTKYAKGYANSLVCTEKNGALPKFLYKRGTPYYIKSKIKGYYTTATNVLNSLKEQKTKQINEQIKTPTKQIPPSSLREGVGVRLL
jgi:hypothetical protein